MKNDNLKLRTKEFAKRVIKLCRQLPRTEEGALIRRQVFRSGTSVGANYRAACRARSKADFVSKMGIVLEEADETLYWLEIIVETEIIKQKLLGPLMKENNELVSIFVASLRTAKEQDSRKDDNV
ncbi:MAG: four helix bundle protein [Planctomycetes bacterium]|nr:four helix bundle protein [Planctomycetota bacterium]